MIDVHFWKDKKVFITGHTGFKGSWLTLWLSSLGATVTGFALKPPTQPNLFELCHLQEVCTSHDGDIRNKEQLFQALHAAAPDIVFHLAAQPLVRASYQHPLETYEINTLGTLYLLEAIRKATLMGVPIKAVINVTSDKCYDNQEWSWGYRETDQLGGADPYSNSKACAELVTACYRQSFFPPSTYFRHQVALATVRAGNVIGGGDWAKDRLVPDCIHALMQGNVLKIRYPQAIRPWQHVLEPLAGYLLLGQKLLEEGVAFGTAWNFGPAEQDLKSVEWIARELCTQWGSPPLIQIEQGNQPPESQLLKLDSSQARQKLQWLPRWNVELVIRKVVEWFKAFQSGQDVREICLQQIKSYIGGGE